MSQLPDAKFLQPTGQLRVRWLGRLRRFWLGLGLTLGAIALLHACSFQAKPELQPLKVGITTWPGFDVILYAKSAGLFEKRGLTVDLVRFENQQDSSRAVLRGALDLAFVSLWDVMQVDPGNDQPTFILVTNISHGADGIVTQAPLKSVESLRGKQVAAQLGTVNHLILLEALKFHNVPPQAVAIANLSNESAAQAIAAGTLDGAVLWQPLLGETAKKSKGNIVYTTRDLDSLVIDGCMTRSSLLQAKRAELTQFLLVWLDVMHAVETKPDEVFATVGQVLKQSQAAFASDYAGLKKGDVAMQERMFGASGRLRAAVQELTQLMKSDPRHGRLPRQDLVIDSDLVNAAIKEWKA